MRFYRNKAGGPVLTEDEARAQYEGKGQEAARRFFDQYGEIQGEELAEEQIKHIIATHAPADPYKYMMLDRLRTDCEYFLGNGDRRPGVLWAGSVGTQLKIMRMLRDSFPEEDRPEWLSAEDLETYAREMAGKDGEE